MDNGELIRRHIPGNTALVVTNETIAPLYLDRTVATLSEGGNIRVEVVILPDGEEHKNMDVLMKVFDKALEAKLDRQTTFVARRRCDRRHDWLCSIVVPARRAFYPDSDHRDGDGGFFRGWKNWREPPSW